LAQRFAIAAHGTEEDGEILDGSGEDGAKENPENARQIAKLGGERGTNERAGAGDGGEVVAEKNPFVGGFEIAAVAEAFGGRRAPIIEHHHFGGDEFAVKTEADGIDADSSRDEPKAIDRFAMIAGDNTQANGGADRGGSPEN
jgi:hypothetical protein